MMGILTPTQLTICFIVVLTAVYLRKLGADDTTVLLSVFGVMGLLEFASHFSGVEKIIDDFVNRKMLLWVGQSRARLYLYGIGVVIIIGFIGFIYNA